MMMNVVAILAMVVAATEAGGMMGMGMGMPMGGMGMFPGMGKMGMMGHPMMHQHEEEAPNMLTCQLNFRDVNDPSIITNSISINIKEKAKSGSSMSGYGGMGMGHMNMNLMNHGTDANKGELEADIGIFSTTGGKVTIGLTETARPQDGCAADSFGHFLKAAGDHHGMSRPMGMMGKYGMGKYGMGGMGGMGMRYGMGYGLPGSSFGSSSVKHQSMSPFGSSNVMKSTNYGGGYGMGGYGMSPMMMGMGMGNPMMMGKMGMMGGVPHTHEEDPEGIIASADCAPGIKASIHLDKLKGFNSLKQLAGRGVIICPSDNIEHDFDDQAKCTGGILACCALHYSKDDVKLGGDAAAARPARRQAYIPG